MVQEEGLEPPHLSVLDPKSSASANFATLAFIIQSGLLVASLIKKLGAVACQAFLEEMTGGSPWNRTKNLQIKSLSLYQLS